MPRRPCCSVCRKGGRDRYSPLGGCERRLTSGLIMSLVDNVVVFIVRPSSLHSDLRPSRNFVFDACFSCPAAWKRERTCPFPRWLTTGSGSVRNAFDGSLDACGRFARARDRHPTVQYVFLQTVPCDSQATSVPHEFYIATGGTAAPVPRAYLHFHGRTCATNGWWGGRRPCRRRTAH